MVSDRGPPGTNLLSTVCCQKVEHKCSIWWLIHGHMCFLKLKYLRIAILLSISKMTIWKRRTRCTRWFLVWSKWVKKALVTIRNKVNKEYSSEIALFSDGQLNWSTCTLNWIVNRKINTLISMDPLCPVVKQGIPKMSMVSPMLVHE
jgi:hypothetical protein